MISKDCSLRRTCILLLKSKNRVCLIPPQRLSAERNTSDSDSVGVSTGEHCRDNGETNPQSLKSICQLSLLAQGPFSSFYLTAYLMVFITTWSSLGFYGFLMVSTACVARRQLHDCTVEYVI